MNNIPILSSKDPIMTAFTLSFELRKLSRIETEFRTEYNVICFIVFQYNIIDQLYYFS